MTDPLTVTDDARAAIAWADSHEARALPRVQYFLAAFMRAPDGLVSAIDVEDLPYDGPLRAPLGTRRSGLAAVAGGTI